MHMPSPLQKNPFLFIFMFLFFSTGMSGAALQHQSHNLGQPLLGFHPQKKSRSNVSLRITAGRSKQRGRSAWDDCAALSLSLSRSPTSQAQRASAARRPPGKHGSSMRWV